MRGLKAGLWTQLSGSYLDNYSEGARKAAQFQGKDYGVPTGISFVTGVYYNKDLFQKNGVQVPTTWDEFIAACEAFKAKGITPIVMGGAEKWPVGLVMEGIVSSSVPAMVSSVLLPEPLGPITATSEPGSIERSTSTSACTSDAPSPYDLHTFSR